MIRRIEPGGLEAWRLAAWMVILQSAGSLDVADDDDDDDNNDDDDDDDDDDYERDESWKEVGIFRSLT